MAVNNYPVIINGTYDIYTVPYVSDSASPLALETQANFVKLGCLQEGFTLTWSFNVKDVQTECLGETIIDGVHLGIGTATLSGVFQEWNSAALSDGTSISKYNNISPTIWPEWGAGGSDVKFGDVASISKQAVYSQLTTPLAAVPRTGTPSATDAHIWYFYATFPEPGNDFSANFNFEEQIVPFTFRCYPVATYINSNTHSIALPSMDTSQISDFATNYTLRFWRKHTTV